jgi:hypothetical protein
MVLQAVDEQVQPQTGGGRRCGAGGRLLVAGSAGSAEPHCCSSHCCRNSRTAPPAASCQPPAASRQRLCVLSRPLPAAVGAPCPLTALPAPLHNTTHGFARRLRHVTLATHSPRSPSDSLAALPLSLPHAHRPLCAVRCALCAVRCALCAVRCALCAVHLPLCAPQVKESAARGGGQRAGVDPLARDFFPALEARLLAFSARWGRSTDTRGLPSAPTGDALAIAQVVGRGHAALPPLAPQPSLPPVR